MFAKVPVWVCRDKRIKNFNFHRKQFCQNCFASLLKRAYSKREELAPMGTNSFPFRIDQYLLTETRGLNGPKLFS